MISLYKQLLNLRERLHLIAFLNKKSNLASKHLLKSGGNSEIDIVTIAFNNAMMVELQIQLIRKYVTDPFTHIIADNSNDTLVRKEIAEVCNKLNTLYVSVPENRFKRNKSHAAAMHWVYKNVIRKRKNKYFGFLDHDIFPVKYCSIINRLKNDIYGRVMPAYNAEGALVPITKEQPHWSLWAGLYFFKAELFSNINVYRLNFFPRVITDGIYLDTGGGLWDTVIKNILYQEEIVKYHSVKFRETQNGNIHTDYYECLDDWIHVVNLSNWFATPDMQQKVDYFEQLLKEKINTE